MVVGMPIGPIRKLSISENVLACKPEDLFLAVSQVEQQLAQKSLKALGGRKKIPIQVFSIMSEHIIPATNSGWRLLGPPGLGTTLLSCTKAHWEECGILPGYLPTSSRFSYTLPDDAEMFTNGVLCREMSPRDPPL
jgi:hypothetical protein